MSYCKRFISLAVGVAVLTVGFSVSASAGLSGRWSGAGFIKPSSGERTSVRCRVSYSQLSAKVFSVSATCASRDHSVRQAGELLMVRPNRFVGDFYSRQFDISGRIAVTLKGKRQTVTFSGDGVTGRLSLRRR